MPFYTFECIQCGIYDEWHKSTASYNEEAKCPSCYQERKRVFLPPNLLFTSQALRKRVDSGMEPKIVKKENIGGKPRHHHKHSQQPKRPWQISH
ncbi:FmdB family zinc ribbon protein [Jeotgalibacillus soli]|uniref:Putative regulatory protein FmdB zinc ribbon domain-containing protein n=1 Tax=Jeotgalibacillus soli TaxID=889306 RepID=A0A0C2VLG7_9BACL|nr:zinc ribbon domain-containing protein [Jeotgalibacillus soli]KIL49762.1 hypothetical protein KP78_12300 [Jeotgalibacillus soli]